jgi:hypothetical protein|tara:strand:+ start:673 stop:897 length:225 start_codon:yes stop_codon:yes gene_type:complete
MIKIRSSKDAIYHERTYDMQGYKIDSHLHSFGSLIYVTNSELKVTDQISGDTITFGAGAKIFGDARIVHLSILV